MFVPVLMVLGLDLKSNGTTNITSTVTQHELEVCDSVSLKTALAALSQKRL